MLGSKWSCLLVMTLALVSFAACGGSVEEEAAPPPATPAPPPPAATEQASMPAGNEAHATLEGAEGSGIVGEVTFTPDPGGVHVSAKVTGLDGAGEHGFHIHETGDCSAADFTSAGGHFNPGGAIHGGPDDAERHAGDLGNITIGPDGSGDLHLVTDLLSLEEGAANSALGRAVVLHAAADDLVSQPTGAAGARLACGVVEGMGG